MTNVEKTGLRSLVASRRHRWYGKACAMIDVDNLESKIIGERERPVECAQFKHHEAFQKLLKKKTQVCAIIDNKKGDLIDDNGNPTCAHIPLDYAIAQQCERAQEWKTAFFIAVDYLEKTECYPIPMYLLIPMNELAIKIYNEIKAVETTSKNYDYCGKWLSEYQYSQFLHQIRNIQFNRFELVNPTKEKNQGIRLNELSQEITTYHMPVFYEKD